MRKTAFILIFFFISYCAYSLPTVYENLLTAENASKYEGKLMFVCFFSSKSDSDTFFNRLNSDDDLSRVLADSYIPVSLDISKSINKQIFALCGFNDVPSAAILNINGYLLDSLAEAHLNKNFILADKLKSNLKNSVPGRRIDYSEVYANVKISYRINSAPSGASVYLSYEGGSREYYGKTPLTVNLKPGDYILTIRSSGLSDYSQAFSAGLEDRNLTYNLLGAKSIISFKQDSTYHPAFDFRIEGSTFEASYDKQYTISSGNGSLYIDSNRVNYNFTAGHSYEITPVFKIPIWNIQVDGLKSLPEQPESESEYRNEYLEIPKLFTMKYTPRGNISEAIKLGVVIGGGIDLVRIGIAGVAGKSFTEVKNPGSGLLIGLLSGVVATIIQNSVDGYTYRTKIFRKVEVENIDEINKRRQTDWQKEVDEINRANDNLRNEKYRISNRNRNILIIKNITIGTEHKIQM